MSTGNPICWLKRHVGILALRIHPISTHSVIGQARPRPVAGEAGAEIPGHRPGVRDKVSPVECSDPVQARRRPHRTHRVREFPSTGSPRDPAHPYTLARKGAGAGSRTSGPVEVKN